MPVTIDQLVSRVCQELQSEQCDVDRDKVARVVRATLKGIDHHINAAGEVYSPVPPPSTVYSGVRTPANVRQGGVHYKGQRRRRGYRR